MIPMATTWRQEIETDLADTAAALEQVIRDLQEHGILVPA